MLTRRLLGAVGEGGKACRWILLVTMISFLPLCATGDPWLGDAQILAADTPYQFRPAVAYNSVHDEFLVVWHADVSGINGIFGTFVDSAGLPLGPSFAIGDPGVNQFRADVAYDPANDRYLVVWMSGYSGDLQIFGRFIPPAGPSTTYPVFTIASAAPDRYDPSVAFNPSLGEYLVVWQNYNASTANWISAQRWAADGSGAITPVLTITSGPQYRIRPKVAWNDLTFGYLIVYERTDVGGEVDIWGTRLSWSGSVLGSEIGIAGWPGLEIEPDLASCRGNYLTVWKGGIGTDAKVYSRAVSGSGTVGSIVSDLSGGDSNQYHASVACNESGAEYLVSLEGAANAVAREVLGVFVEIDGTSRGSFQIVRSPTATVDFTRPALAFGSHAEALVAWEENPLDGGSQGIAGRLVGGRLFADGFESGDLGYWAAAP